MSDHQSGKGPEPTTDKVVMMRQLALPTAVIVVFAVLTWPVWRWLSGEWMANDYYSHGILIVPVTLYLAWRRLQNERAWSWASIKGDNRGLFVLLLSLAAYLYFLNGKAYYLAAFALIGLSVGIVWGVMGWRTLSLVSFPMAYLLFMVPLPFVERATLPLALFTGVCSSSFVRFFGVELTTVGNAISLPNAELVVGAQCSGINSMIALTAINALAAYVVAGPWWGRLALVLAAVPIAMVGNIFRVANLLVVARSWGAEAAFDFYHTYSGLFFFALALLLLIPLTKLLRCSTLRLDVL